MGYMQDFGLSDEEAAGGTPDDHQDDPVIVCPDCGPVRVVGDVFERGRPISGECPKCGDRLYFAEPPCQPTE